MSLPFETVAAALDAVADGVIVLAAGRVAVANPAACALTGREAAELLGGPFPFPCLDPPEQADLAAAIASAAEGRARELEVVLHGPAGARIEVLATAAPVPPGHVAVTLKDLTGRHRHAGPLSGLSTRDELTGLLNRRGVLARLEGEVARAVRHGRALSLVLADLDRFATYTGEHGLAAGDRILCGVAERLARVARLGDVTGRVGGDEFCWLLPDADGAGTVAAVERLRHALAGLRLPVSVGICDLAAASHASVAGLVRTADEALHWAKRDGGDRVVRWSARTAERIASEHPGELVACGRRGTVALARALGDATGPPVPAAAAAREHA